MMQFDESEQTLLDSVENGEWQSKPDLTQRKRFLQQCAQQQLDEAQTHLDITLSARDFEILKMFASKEGIHNYPAFIESIVHRYLQERLEIAS